MMKKLKKAVAMICAATFLACLAPSAVFAEGDENTGEYLYGLTEVYEASDGVELHGNSYPTETWNLATKGQYDFSGKCNGSASLYTNYMFTGVDAMVIHVNNKKSSSLTVTLVRNGVLNLSVHTFSVPANTTKIETVRVDSDAKYSIKFSCPSEFDGYVF